MLFFIWFLISTSNAQEIPTMTLPVEIRVYSENQWTLSYDDHTLRTPTRQQANLQVTVPAQPIKMSLIAPEKVRLDFSSPLHFSVFNETDSEAIMESVTRSLHLSVTPENWDHLQSLENKKYLIFDQISEAHLDSFSKDIAQNNMEPYFKQSANHAYPLELRLFKKIIIHISLENLNSKKNISVHQIYIDSSLESLYPWKKTESLPRIIPVSQPRQLGQLRQSYESENPLIVDFFAALHNLNQRYRDLEKRGWLQTLWTEKSSEVHSSPSGENIVSLSDYRASSCRKIFE